MDSSKASPSAGPICDQVVAMLSAPLGDDDLQLALYLCFELHYRSFPNVDPAWEWNPTLLAVRAVLEEVFFKALEAEIDLGDPVDPTQIGDLLFRLESEDDGVSLSRHLEVEAESRNFASSSSTAPSTS